MTTRRNFLQLSALSTLTATLVPRIVQSANVHLGQPTSRVGNRILFQGDSITDANRDRGNYYANVGAGMGSGYVQHIVTNLLGKNPGQDYQFYNRGISGHKVFQLAGRWDDDCLNLRPDVLSILIGVNDYWHSLGGGYDGTVETYENDFRALLNRTSQSLPNTKLIIGEPFAVEGGTAINEQWQAFGAYRLAARAIAKDFGALFLPYHDVFAEALKIAPAKYWCPDGVHPSMAGSFLMKETWIAGFQSL